MSDPTATIVSDFSKLTSDLKQGAFLNLELKGVQELLLANGGVPPSVLLGEPSMGEGAWATRIVQDASPYYLPIFRVEAAKGLDALLPALLLDGIIRFRDLWESPAAERMILVQTPSKHSVLSKYEEHVRDVSYLVSADIAKRATSEEDVATLTMAYSANLASSLEFYLSSVAGGVSNLPLDVRVLDAVFSSFPAFRENYIKAITTRLKALQALDFGLITLSSGDPKSIYSPEGVQTMVSEYLDNPGELSTLIKILVPVQLQTALLLTATSSLKVVSSRFEDFEVKVEGLEGLDEKLSQLMDMTSKALDRDLWEDTEKISDLVLSLASSDDPFGSSVATQKAIIHYFGLDDCYHWDSCVSLKEAGVSPWDSFDKSILGVQKVVEDTGLVKREGSPKKGLPDDLKNFDFTKAMEDGVFGKVSDEVH